MSRKHRALVYCDDNASESWGWWCRDCPQYRDATSATKTNAERLAYRHADNVQVASGSSRSTLRKESAA